MTNISPTPWPSAPSPASPPSRRGRGPRRAPFDPPAPRDAADVLADVYAVILTWPTAEERAAAARLEADTETAAGGGA